MDNSQQEQEQHRADEAQVAVEEQPALKEWSKPDLESLPLKDALGTFAGVGADSGIYS